MVIREPVLDPEKRSLSDIASSCDAAGARREGERVLVLAPIGRDGPMIVQVLASAGLTAETCPAVPELCRCWDAGAGAAIVAEEALVSGQLACLVDHLKQQPVWSDFPLVILTAGGAATRVRMALVDSLKHTGNVTFLERPLRILTLVSSMESALRARRRQYEVRTLLEQAQQAVRQRDEFLAVLGHELRNPLAAIRAAIEVLGQANPADAELATDQRQIISRQTTHVARLVDDLLDVTRVTTGKIILDRRPADLNVIAQYSLTALRGAMPLQGHDLVFEPASQPVPVDVDPDRVQQVLTNLLTNAVKYSPAGGRVLLRISRDGDCGTIHVRDNGIGIPADMLTRIFEPFTQVEKSLARSRGGLGLGLTVVRSLVQMHGGSVSVHSDGAGRGSEFIVRLPITTRRLQEGEPRRAERTTQPRRVLVVEDNPDTRRAMKSLLRLWGHQAEVAPDGPAGVEKALSWRPPVALVDIGLPGMDGYEVARRLRAAFGHGIYLIALTGYGQTEDRRLAHEAGFDCHMVKPVDPEQLQHLLADGLAQQFGQSTSAGGLIH